MSILFDTIEALQQENEQLRAQVGKPTIEQVAWIAKCICQNADEQGTFRHLIYDIMGYGGEAYQPLCEAGLLRINNSMTELTPEQVEALQQENEQLRKKKGRKMKIKKG
jgi:FtsZ-binding cell division protein ZapB